MPRKPRLDDNDTRASILRDIAAGLSEEEAASRHGVVRQTIYRYAKRHEDFAEHLRLAREEGRLAILASHEAEADDPDPPPPDPPPPEPPPPEEFPGAEFSGAIVETAELLGVEPGFVEAADRMLERSTRVAEPAPPPPTVSTIDGTDLPCVGTAEEREDDLPPLTMRNWMIHIWRTARDRNHKASADCNKMLGKIMLGPTIDAQERQMRRLAAEAERSQDLAASASGRAASPAVIIEIPRNGSEAPGHGPQPMEGSVLEAEVVGG